MKKLLFFYDENCQESVTLRNHILKHFADKYELRVAAKKPGTATYFLKHEVKKTPTIILLNYVDRELKRQENIKFSELNTFLNENRKRN